MLALLFVMCYNLTTKGGTHMYTEEGTRLLKLMDENEILKGSSDLALKIAYDYIQYLTNQIHVLEHELYKEKTK